MMRALFLTVSQVVQLTPLLQVRQVDGQLVHALETPLSYLPGLH